MCLYKRALQILRIFLKYRMGVKTNLKGGNMIYILYARITADTGKKLAEDLGAEHGQESPSERVDCLVRWGSGDGVRFNPRVTINSKDSILNTVNKLQSIRLFREHRVRTPRETTEVPLIARTVQHTQGQGLWLCWTPEQLVEVRREGAEYFVDYIPTKQEYRVHVIDGECIFIQRKYSTERHTTAFGGIQGFRDNWHKQVLNPSEAPVNVIIQGVNAVNCLGLDMGGADVIEDLQGHVYVLEVNSGPALPTPETRAPYVEFIRRKSGG